MSQNETKPADYRNRILDLEYVNAADLTPHPGNWRAMADRGLIDDEELKERIRNLA